jgi:hypothetical protein
MDASTLYANTLQSLVDTRKFFITEPWIEAVNAEPLDVRQAVQKAEFSVERTIVSLSNAILSDIASQMVAQTDELGSATQDLEASINEIPDVAKILDDITDTLSVIGKFVSIL